MPTLYQSLYGHDLAHLQIIADLWGVALRAPDQRQGSRQLVDLLLDAPLLHEIVESLPAQANAALTALQHADGRLPWTQFIRQYGEVRQIGAARRDREKPHRNPTSTSEILWYRALLARASYDDADGPQEFAYIPDDLLTLLPPPPVETAAPAPLSRPATPAERAKRTPASSAILDHACTLLAARRVNLPDDELTKLTKKWPYPVATLQTLLQTAGLVNEDHKPKTQAARAFLEAPRPQALLQLFSAWCNSPSHNDLHLIPQLIIEGTWKNAPLQTRQVVLALLAQLDADHWWSLPALISTVQEHHPDFQRSGSEYDSWYIKERDSKAYLRGFAHWTAVEGRLLTYLVTGPLHWLGLIELGAPDEDAPPVAFRFSRWAQQLLAGKAPERLAAEDQPVYPDSRLRLLVPSLAPRAVRYQIARFCQWDGMKKDNYSYRVTPAALTRAQAQGLEIRHLLTLLKRHSETRLPPNLTQALERWAAHGSQARFQQSTVLRVERPEIIQALRDSRAARFLGDPLGPTAIIVKGDAWQNVMDALAEMGYLSINNQD